MSNVPRSGRIQLTLEALTSMERQGWDALCRSTGADFYGRVMTAEALMILVNGMVLDREAVVASLSQAPPWDEYELSDERWVPVDTHAAAVVYRAVARRTGEEPFEALMSSTYVLVDGAPRLVLYQQTLAA